MNVGIMGISENAERMACTISQMDEAAVLYAVSSNDLANSKEFANRYGIVNFYGNHEEMLKDASLDLVYIASHHTEHHDQAELCLKYNKRFIVESPFCINSAETEDIIYKADVQKLFFAENMNLRFLPAVKQIKNILSDGRIGEIKKLEAVISEQCCEREDIQDMKLCGGALLNRGLYSLNWAAILLGTNVTSIESNCEKLNSGVDAREEIILSYFDGRKAVIKASVIDESKSVCSVIGTLGRLEFGPINEPNYIRIYDKSEKIISTIDISDDLSGYKYSVQACIKAINDGQRECDEITQSETLRMMNWMDNLRSMWEMIYPIEKKEDLCKYSGPGLKKYMIVPFRKYWLDCLNCIVNSLIDYFFSVPQTYYYNNDYVYEYTEETSSENGYLYQSLLPVTDSFKTLQELWTDNLPINLSQAENPIKIIKEAIDHNKTVLLAVDLYHWVNSGMHYQHNHIWHFSLVIGYDDNSGELIVFETGDYGYAEFRVPYDRAITAMRANPSESSISHIDRNKKIAGCSKEEIKHNAKKVADSIKRVISNMEAIWKIEGIEEKEATGVFDIISSHMYSMQNRMKLNSMLISQIGEDEEYLNIANQFRVLGDKYGKLKNIAIKLRMKKMWKEKIKDIKSELELNMKEERKLWEKVIALSK